MKRRVFAFAALGTVLLLLPAGLVMPAATATGSLAGQKICIDPGHGGADPGAVNESFGLHESEINLDVSHALMALLEGDGAEVVMTRYDDSYLTNRDRYSFCNAQQATILISVHTNGSTDPAMDGTLGLYFHEDDRALAQALYDEMWPALRDSAPDPASFVGFGLNKFASGVLLKSDMPAAMMEPLFMSNAAEAELLAQDISDGCSDLSCRRGQIARTMYDGVLSYFGGPEPTPTPEPGGTLFVAGIDMRYSQKGPNFFVYTRVTIHDTSGQPVTDALVSVTTSQPDGQEVQSSGSTGEDGSVTISLRTRQTGKFVSTVTAVSKAGWMYDEALNVETSEELIVP
jgi:N-acetylmuramoyl-L-alanine amidase